MGAPPIHTRTEFYVQSLLKLLDVPFEVDRILCFTCNGARFYWNDHSLPEKCAIGWHPFSRGQFCRPDILLVDRRAPMPVSEKCKMSVLRIDGWIHDKSRVKARDRGQERELLRLGIPYFVAENSFFDPIPSDKSRIPRQHLDFLLAIWSQTINQDIYRRYQMLKEVRDTKLI